MLPWIHDHGGGLEVCCLNIRAAISSQRAAYINGEGWLEPVETAGIETRLFWAPKWDGNQQDEPNVPFVAANSVGSR